MSMRAQLRGAAISAFLGSPMRKALSGLKRTFAGASRRVTFFHQIDDPYSHLLVQTLPELLARFPALELEMVLVPAPAADADPEPELRREYAALDAARIAERSDLRFPVQPEPIPDDRLRRAHAVLLQERSPEAQVDAAIRIGDAIWSADGESLSALVKELGAVPGQHVRPKLEESYRRLRKAGHYQGAMLEYAGEWFWGVDRLEHLISRLVSDGVGDNEVPIVSFRPSTVRHAEPVECFFSFRSPYSYLALEEIQHWPEHGAEVRLRPILPMVMRGLPAPRDKRLYIVRDAKREADKLEIPFGRICDPLGAGVERCIAVVDGCSSPAQKMAFSLAAMRGIWSRAIDVSTDKGLLSVAEEAGLSEEQVRAALAAQGWRDLVETNRVALQQLGHWGVPTLVQGELVCWGQDRLWLIAERLGIPLRSGKSQQT